MLIAISTATPRTWPNTTCQAARFLSEKNPTRRKRSSTFVVANSPAATRASDKYPIVHPGIFARRYHRERPTAARVYLAPLSLQRPDCAPRQVLKDRQVRLVQKG